MILPAYLQDEVKKYCEIRGFRMIRGNVESKHIPAIQNFIKERLRKDRSITKRKEEDGKLTIQSTVNKILKEGIIESPIEQYLAEALAREGLLKYCRPQFEIGKYRVDFAFPIAKLFVEADGKAYHFTEASQIERDQERDKYLARKGWHGLHLEGLAIRRNIGLCMEKIKEALQPFL